MVNILQFSFSLSYTGPKFLLYTFLSKIIAFYLSLLVSNFLMHIFKTCCVLFVLFSTKCCLFHNFIFFCSNNTFFINHVLKFKYHHSCLKVNMLQGLSLFLSLNSVSNSESLQHELFPVVFTSDYAYEKWKYVEPLIFIFICIYIYIPVWYCVMVTSCIILWFIKLWAMTRILVCSKEGCPDISKY